MPENKITRDELLILLRDTYLNMNHIVNNLRDVFFENLDAIADALVKKQIATQNNNSEHKKNGHTPL